MTSRIHNPDCCGSHCRSATGTVKLYPLGGGANLILCAACWAHENRYRFHRDSDTEPNKFPVLDWGHADTFTTSE